MGHEPHSIINTKLQIYSDFMKQKIAASRHVDNTRLDLNTEILYGTILLCFLRAEILPL